MCTNQLYNCVCVCICTNGLLYIQTGDEGEYPLFQCCVGRKEKRKIVGCCCVDVMKELLQEQLVQPCFTFFFHLVLFFPFPLSNQLKKKKMSFCTLWLANENERNKLKKRKKKGNFNLIKIASTLALPPPHPYTRHTRRFRELPHSSICASCFR